MIRFVSLIAASVALLSALPMSPADAHFRRDRYWRADGYHDRYRYLPLGYHRRGPLYGYKFGFATYRGDPFARDDYYDGRGCYYLHRRDMCLRFRPPLNGFR